MLKAQLKSQKTESRSAPAALRSVEAAFHEIVMR